MQIPDKKQLPSAPEPELPSWVGVLSVCLVVLLTLGVVCDQLFNRLATHLPGLTLVDAGDALWHLWWASSGYLESDGLVINAWVGAPFLLNHLTELPIFQGFLYRLLDAFASPILAFNVIFIISFVATHLAFFAYFQSRSSSIVLGAAASTAFMLSPWYFTALSRPDLALVGLWPFPLALLCWDRWLAVPSKRRAASLVIVLSVAVMSGASHLAWLLGAFLPYSVVTGISQRDRFRVNSASRNQLPIMGLLIAVLLLIFPLPAMIRSLLGNEPPFGPAHYVPIPDTSSFIGVFLDTGPVIWLSAFVAIYFVRPFRKNILMLATGVIFLLMGVHLVPEPWRMLASALALPYQPLYRDEVFLGLALISLLTFVVTIGGQYARTRPIWQSALVSVLFVVVVAFTSPSVFQTLPTQPVTPSPVYDQLAAESEDYLLLTYPFGLYSTFDGQNVGKGAELAIYAPWHHKRMLGGSAPYVDPEVFERFEELPFLDRKGTALSLAALPEFNEAVNTWRIGYVLVYRANLSPEEFQQIEEFLAAAETLCPPEVYADLIIYRARWHPLSCSTELTFTFEQGSNEHS